jgi:hypothetical protein
MSPPPSYFFYDDTSKLITAFEIVAAFAIACLLVYGTSSCVCT